jgi:hypothetical protein
MNIAPLSPAAIAALFPTVRATRTAMLTNFGTQSPQWYMETINEPETITGAQSGHRTAGLIVGGWAVHTVERS